MSEVKAPYNFVPLNEKVFFPYWSEFVSQDVPFKNALSGQIRLKITARTPIFIRGKEDDNKSVFIDNNDKKIEYSIYHPFKLNNQYCIPGTSIKGEIESVLEILSFGKLKKINRKEVFSVRDMADSDLLMGKANGCGFLIKRNGGYVIEDCGKLLTISYDEINKATGKYISAIDNIKDKYDIINPLDINVSTQIKNMKLRNGKNIRKTIAVYDSSSGIQGKLVFCGNITGKKNEFVFIKNKSNINIDKNVFNDFADVYFAGESDSGNYWKQKFEDGKSIPVFYKKEGGKIQAIGLSQLFKLKYENTINDLLPGHHASACLDFIETIFGFTPDENQKVKGYKERKGRVSIEPAINTNKPAELPLVTTILGSPKATYYPYYLWQKLDDNTVISGVHYNTFMNDNAELSGRKRYPVRKKLPDLINSSPSDVTVSFCPLDKGAEFETTIHYHNLRQVELGGLLSALTFHNTYECHHSLGMAKPLGFGNVKFEIDFEHSTIDTDEIQTHIGSFERVMSDFNPNWLNSEQVKELMSIATPIDDNHPKIELLKYLELMEFAELKKDKKALQRYSKFMDISLVVKGLSSKSNFNVNNDMRSFKIDKTKIQKNINQYIDIKKTEIEQKINQKIENISVDIKKMQNKIKSDERSEFQKQGIKPLLEQKTINGLISITRSWIGRFYSNENQKKIYGKKMQAIPDKYEEEFLAHIQRIYDGKPKDRAWRASKNKTSNYLKMCIGEEKSKKWFINNSI